MKAKITYFTNGFRYNNLYPNPIVLTCNVLITNISFFTEHIWKLF